MYRFATAFAALAAACAVSGTAVAATTLTFNFGGASQTFAVGAPYSVTVGGVTASAYGYSFGGAPAAFQASNDGALAATVLGTLTAKSIRREARGLGVCWPGEAGNQCNQVDSDGINELLRIVLPTGYKLVSATFDRVDTNDTLKLYGVTTGGVIDYLGFGGTFDGPGNTLAMGGGVGGGWIGGNLTEDQIYRVNFATGANKEYWFGNNNDAADGYRLDSITLAAVPEPGAWVLMIAGFGMTGAMLRSRRLVPVRA